MKRIKFILSACLLPTCLLSAPLAMALPPNGEVTAGSATFSSPNADTLHINQHTDKVVIEYPSFSIGSGETVQFIQPDSNSIALNRVIGSDVSQIFGQLQANGQVFLVNSNGIVFAPGSRVDVGGLVATTLNINDADFMASNFKFVQADGAQNSVINQGQLHAIPEGYIALIATRVTNEGTITADFGNVALVSADQVQIQIAGHQFAIQTDAASWNGIVDNQNTIQADGGVVLLEANTENRLFETVVNNDGVIKANRLENRGGEIWLKGGSQGDVWQSGSLDASGVDDSGGQVSITGHRIAHSGEIKVSGNNDGGQVDLLADDTVVLTSGSVIQANAGIDGNGGEIKAFSPNTAIFREGAAISATGGSQSGDGGFVDVSGWQQVESAGNVDLTAANGDTGDFIIDPWNITIDAANSNGSFDGGAPTNTWVPSATGSTINTSTITTNLATANVSIRTDGGGGAEAGNIAINSDIDLDGSNGNTLSFFADAGIYVNANIADQNTATVDNTNISMTASGVITVANGNTIDAGGGTITMTSSTDITVSGLRTTSASATAVNIVSNGSIIGNAGGVTTEIYAPNGGLAFTATGNVSSVNTEVASIDLANNSGALEFTEIDDVTLSGGANSSSLSLTSGGTVTVSGGNLSSLGALSIGAVDLNAASLSATDLTLSLSGGAGDLSLNTSVNRADISVVGRNLSITESNGLVVEDLDSDSSSLSTTNGNLTVTVQSGNLTINDNVTATDTVADANRTGLIDLLVNGGNVNIGSGGATQIISNNTADQSAAGGLGSTPTNQTAIRIRQISGADSSAAFTFGDANGNDVVIRAIGGDVYVDSQGGATLSAGNSRDIIVNSDVTIQAYDNGADPTDGSVAATDITNNGTIVAHTGRAIQLGAQSLVTTTAPELNNTVTDIVTAPEIPEQEKVRPEDSLQQPEVNQLFTDVFGDCLADPNVSQEQCQKQHAIRRFMGALLIGGEIE